MPFFICRKAFSAIPQQALKMYFCQPPNSPTHTAKGWTFVTRNACVNAAFRGVVSMYPTGAYLIHQLPCSHSFHSADLQSTQTVSSKKMTCNFKQSSPLPLYTFLDDNMVSGCWPDSRRKIKRLDGMWWVPHVCARPRHHGDRHHGDRHHGDRATVQSHSDRATVIEGALFGILVFGSYRFLLTGNELTFPLRSKSH